MKHSSIYGAALIVGAVGMVVTMIFHPTGHDLLSQAEQIARRNELITVITHSLALASIPILIFGFSGLSRRLGWDSPPASAALIAMKDPVVIPYLELATSRTRSQVFADALWAMNSPEARAALERLAASKDPEVRALAQRTLAGGR